MIAKTYFLAKTFRPQRRKTLRAVKSPSGSVAVCVIGCPVAVARPVSAVGRGWAGAGPWPRAAGGAAQHVKKIQHVKKAHSSYAIFAVLNEIDVLSGRNVRATGT